MTRVLLTTTSFQDTPGVHHDMLAQLDVEVVRERGPLSEARMLELAGQFDAFLCGDDAITAAVIDKSLPRLKVISKYGIGLDKIDVAHATSKKIPVLFTPGVNHTTVAEHTFLLLLALEKNILFHTDSTRSGGWKRKTGHELLAKTIGIVGLGRIGKEVAIRARAFGMEVIAYDIYWDEAFAKQHNVKRVATKEEIFTSADYISLHTNLTPETRDMINAKTIATMKKGVLILNCARGEIVHTADMVAALKSGQVGGYGADVLDAEPPPADHPLLNAPNCIITPHIGSRTYESVVRQASCCVSNYKAFLEGNTVNQANKF
ncbi:phosphoglycerate dehydrogenase [Geminisphaera colitermitum]|uniref:phosphoglycerate dehydrogenase n=1 Tax=Geminisphaera colitermitum TaxID=1148786 RepID=UPI000158CA05|nr:phosphoglycerate dehydrogenase [Geminisphaera colitermitum]